MIRILRLLGLMVVCGLTAAHAQTRAFNDTFTGASTVNANPSSPAFSTSTAASYQQLSAKAFSPSPPVVSSGNLRFGIVSTSSGFNSIQALFTKYPVTLVNTGDYLELKVVFNTEGGIITPQTNSTLFLGLFNGGQIQPLAGGLNGTINSAFPGGAQTWTGYVNRIFYTGGSNAFFTRPAQTAAGTNNQDLLFQYSGATAVGSGATSALAAFTANATYTEVFRITKTSATALSLASSLYSGATVTGTPLYTQTVASTTTLTNVFDGFSIGWRATASLASTMNLKSVTITTTGTTTILPEISTQPLGVTKSTGDSQTFTVVADGGVGTTLRYQWQKAGAPIAGATSASYTIPSVALTDAGDYTVVVSDAAGATTSAVATLNVTTGAVAPTFLVQPTGGTITTGGSFTFTATVNGTAPISYSWERSTDGGVNYTPIAGASAASYTLSNAVLTDAGLYHLVATNSAGAATSNAVTLNVNAAPSITNQPVGGSINPGDSITLSVTATGTPTPTYQWRKNGVNIAGATGTSYTITGATGADTASYTVIATNSVGSVTSSPATVAVVSASMAASATTPAASGARNPDVRLSITFNQTPIIGVQGFIRIYDAATNNVVDTIDLVAATALRDSLRASSTLSTQLLPVQTKPIGGIATNFNYYPVTVTGNTATIYPRNGVLAYGKTYYVKVDAGAFVNSTGEAFAGITDASTWRFSTKASGPATGSTSLAVAADGSGDFDTVQAALDFVPANNTTPTVINVKNGTYFEEVAFQSKHFVTVVGQNSDQTVIAYPNNNTFNNVSGVYHRGTFIAQSVHDFTIANLTVNNTTPQNGSQAEALIINGSSYTVGHNIVTRCKFYSYQDTVQFNKQTYVSDSTIWGDVDFMWGDGPTFMQNCDIRILRSGSYFTQIRNSSGNHGFVFVNCRFTAPAGITGTFLGRIDPTSANFPSSETVVLDSTFGDSTNNALLNTTTGVSGANYLGGWWLLNNVSSASGAPNVHDWTNNLVSATGSALTNPNSDTFTNMPGDATTQANYRNASWVLNTSITGTVNGTWTPTLAPVIVTPPTSLTVNAGDPATFSVVAFGVPAPTYQWRKNGADIPGATDASFTINAATATDADTYSVVVTNSAGTVTSSAVTLLVNGGPPVITQHPVTQSAFAGTNASFNVLAVGNGPFTYQWFKNGQPISGANGSTLLLANVQAGDAGSYNATVSNANGFDTSHAAALTIATPYNNTTLALPSIPTTTFRVTDYGAVGDNATDNTAAIAATIAAAKAAGGGIIEFPAAPAAYLSGPIALSSNLDLQVDGGAILRALPYGTYPNPNTHFITWASGSTNIAITGNGTIDGNGAAWWAAFNAGTITTRPRLVQFTKASNVLITGVTFLNSPNFNLAFSGANNNVTIYGVSIIAPGDSPNTDGMDLAGTNFLVQNCYVSNGDDNIVAKPGSVFCSNIVVANCAFGTGHGVSVGGQTNVGLDGMLVTDCTFDGTSSALRLKADATQGGPVQNVTFQNLTMKNVQYPILFYSYYNQLGSPGATSGSSQTTPAKVNTWNAQPPNSLAATTIPTWKNITVRNLTVTNGSGYSTIWGLPTANALIQNVTLENVTIQGGAGLELYDATNIQLVGTNSVGPILTCNALAITGQPVAQTVSVGNSVSFSATAVGGSGTNNAGLTYRWNLEGNPLADGPQADGSTISGAATTTLTITNARVTKAGNYTLTASTTLDGFNTTTNALVANSLPVSATSQAALLTVNPVPASVLLSNLNYTYDGSAKVPTVTTGPANVAVTLTYNGAAAAPINAGSYAVIATIADPNYFGSAADILTITKADPVLGWSAPAAITYGTPLGAAQLNATSDVAGVFNYAPVAGTVLPAGAGQSLTAGFTPTDTANYNSGIVATTITVDKATPLVAWSTPAGITYGTALGSAQLNATANVPGSFVYAPAAGTVLNAGPDQVLSATFMPADTANYNGASAATTITVDKATPALAWPTPAAITYGAALGSTQLNATASVPGAFTYTPAAGTVLNAGPSQGLSAAFTPADTANYYGGTVTTTITVNKATPVLAWSTPAAITYGTALGSAQLNATASVAGSFAYTPAAGAVLNAGPNQALSAAFTPTDAGNYTGGTVATTITVNKATPTLTWSTPAAITYGTALGSVQLNASASVPGSFAYTPAAGTVLNAGPNQALSAAFTPTDAGNYNGGTVATALNVNKAVADVLFGNLAQTYTGSPKSVTVTTAPANLAVTVTYAGSSTPPTAAGSYAVAATVNDANYTGSASSTLVISKAAASISLAPLTQAYDGTPRTVTATTVPTGLTVDITYDNGSTTAPIYPGAHPVTATINDANYQATFTDTLNITITALVRHAPTLNGLLDGSIQVLTAESIALSGNAALSGDLLMLGTPAVALNGHASLGTTINGLGAAQPSSHSLTLSGNALVPVLVRRVDAIALPSVSAPPAPTGTRSVTLNRPTDSAGDFTTLRNLTLNSNVGRVTLPAGTYGDCTINSGSSLVLGVDGATTPAVYNLQNLTLNGGSKLEVIGPVILTLANGTTINASAGSDSHPSWLDLRVASGGLTINGSGVLYAHVTAPNGTVTINGNAALHGSVAADRLTLNGNAALDEDSN